jgi:hypothetical protein
LALIGAASALHRRCIGAAAWEHGAAVFASYRAVFRAPGSLAFCVAALVMRLPLAMFPIGIVLLISARSGQYGQAGALAGVYTVATGAAGPLTGRLTDRIGQTRMLLPALLANAIGGTALLVLAHAGAPIWALVLPAALIGASYLNVTSLVRARWTFVLGDRGADGTEGDARSAELLGSAYSLESVLDELLFVLGPVLVTSLALISPEVAIALAVALVCAGSLMLRTRRDSDPPARPTGERHPSPIRTLPLQAITVAMICIGGVFGSAEVSMVAFADEHGRRGLSGLLLMCFALGSAVSGLFYGARSWSLPLPARFAIQGLVFGLMQPLFLAARSLPELGLIATVVGLATAPMLITGFSFVGRVVPGPSLTEGLSWAGTGLSFGYASGAAFVGVVIDHAGAHGGFALSAGFGLGATAISALAWRLACKTGPIDPAQTASAS